MLIHKCHKEYPTLTIRLHHPSQENSRHGATGTAKALDGQEVAVFNGMQVILSQYGNIGRTGIKGWIKEYFFFFSHFLSYL